MGIVHHTTLGQAQLLTYTDDVDLNQKLQAWEQFYNFHRPHFSHQGRTPYEVMRSLLVRLLLCPEGYGAPQL